MLLNYITEVENFEVTKIISNLNSNDGKYNPVHAPCDKFKTMLYSGIHPRHLKCFLFYLTFFFVKFLLEINFKTNLLNINFISVQQRLELYFSIRIRTRTINIIL